MPVDASTPTPTTSAAPQRHPLGLLVGAAAVPAVAVALVLALLGLGWIAFVGGLVVGVALAVVAWLRSDAVVLRSTGAVPASPVDHARLHNLIEGLSVTIGVAKPSLHVVDAPSVNALATSRTTSDASLVITTGMLRELDRMQLEGVLAQLLVRTKQGHAAEGSLAVTTLGAPTHLADRVKPVGSVLFAASPLLARLLHGAVGAPSDVALDAAAARATRFPPGLLGALEVAQRVGTVVPGTGRATAHLWFASPLELAGDGPEVARNRTFDRHDPLSLRIDALREL